MILYACDRCGRQYKDKDKLCNVTLIIEEHNPSYNRDDDYVAICKDCNDILDNLLARFMKKTQKKEVSSV